ncbi:MAG: F0F1 ATP synthase subunit B [Firmicutes bacterium]|nr:F0F1 ATP synthase subunit B [Bacillota bacterium]
MHITLSPATMLLEFISVLLLFFALRKWAYPPVLQAMKERQNHIRSEIEQAERLRAEAQAMKAELEAEIRNTRARAEEALARARRQASEEGQALLEQARQESKRIIAEAQAAVRAEEEAAMRRMRQHIVDLAMEVAERLMRERLDQDTDRRLVAELIDRVEVPQ